MATPLPNGVRVPTTLPRLEKERLDTLARRVKGEIGVLYSEKQLDHSKMAASIASYLRTLNGDIKTHLLRYDHQNWVERAKEAGVLLFVFLGMPPLRAKRRIIVRRSSGLGTSSTPEEEYMSKVNRKVSDVVVLLPNMPSAKSEPAGEAAEVRSALPGPLLAPESQPGTRVAVRSCTGCVYRSV